MPILLDTHAWIWWVTEDRRLSRAAHRLIDREQARDGLLLSAISVWVLAKKVEQGQLVLDRPVDTWLDPALHRPGMQVVARDREAVILTRDQRIASYPHVRSAW